MMPCPCFGGQDRLIPVFFHFSGMKSPRDDDEEEEQPPSVQPLQPPPKSWGSSEASCFIQLYLQMFLKFLVDLIHRKKKKINTLSVFAVVCNFYLLTFKRKQQ